MSKTLAPSVVTTRDPKGRKFVSIVETAYNKASLSDEEAQRVNEATGLADLVDQFIAENRLTDKFKDEEVESSYRYPQEYKGPKPIEEQILALAKIFNLDPTQALKYTKNLPQLPKGAEGWFAVVSPGAIQKLFPDTDEEAERYCRMLQIVHEKIAASRRFYNYREGQIDTAHLKVHPRTAQMMSQLAEQQPGHILIIAAQLGMRHRGRSSRRAREVFTTNEFGLTSVSVGSIILTHPERLVRWEELDMDCAGDEFSDEGVEQFERAPCFFFSDDGVGFGTRVVSRPGGGYGSASALLPQ